ncbi:hypothetical protein LH464_22600 [Neorhizobium sp. T786]|uniref:hypothetical protein n=1 Tax=Pseudorhizobium xiangyangii TaxID=2883104 RepID=UPI001D000F02|nr:hypothetical protein [Neorhizobium xiangyangii]MCB5205257.1 hypothetical protein [Neorhizobium xiangyangii]
MVLITHDVEEAIYLSDRIIMHPGPGRIAVDSKVDFKGPRDRASHGFADIRRHILRRRAICAVVA